MIAAVDGLAAAWAEAEAALPLPTCDLAVYHYDDGPPIREGDDCYVLHQEPAKYAARTRLTPTEEVFGYGLSPTDALRDLVAALRRVPA